LNLKIKIDCPPQAEAEGFPSVGGEKPEAEKLKIGN
jgi:hypothetical protein